MEDFLCGTQDGIQSLFSEDIWCDVRISDRYPGNPQSIDAILKIDEALGWPFAIAIASCAITSILLPPAFEFEDCISSGSILGQW